MLNNRCCCLLPLAWEFNRVYRVILGRVRVTEKREQELKKLKNLVEPDAPWSSLSVQEFYDNGQGEGDNNRRLFINYMYLTINEKLFPSQTSTQTLTHFKTIQFFKNHYTHRGTIDLLCTLLIHRSCHLHLMWNKIYTDWERWSLNKSCIS